MKIAPIIHSRTLKSDFNSNFAVRPKDLNVDWAMSKILPSTRDIDILDGVRRVVANDGKICIAGIACNFKMFAEKFLSAEERDDAKKYFCDERGREIKVFLGYAFKDSGTPDVSASKLWKMFEKYFAPQWELEAPETKFAGYDEECATKSVGKKSFDKKFYSSNEHADIELFEQCLAQRKDFCSNVDSVKIFEDGKYKIITALPSVINRLQAEAQKKNSTVDYAQRTIQSAYTTNLPSQPPKPANFDFDRKEGLLNADNYRHNTSRNNIDGDSILCDESAIGGKRGKPFANIDELLDELKRNYKGSEVGKRFNDKYRVTTVDSETGLFIWEKLKGFLNKRDVKIIFLVVEEIDG